MTCNNLPPDSDLVNLDNTLGDNFAKNVPMPLQFDDGLTARRVKLTWQASEYQLNQTDGVRIRVDATNAQNMPSKIFAYLLQPLAPGAEARVAAFDHVCSPSDLEEFPENAPAAGAVPAWFRLNYVDIVVRSRTEAHIFIRELAEDVYYLKRTLDATDRVFPAGEIVIGTPIPAPSSSSSSASSGSSSSSASSGVSSSSSSSG
jgi:hypothetical protein